MKPKLYLLDFIEIHLRAIFVPRYGRIWLLPVFYPQKRMIDYGWKERLQEFAVQSIVHGIAVPNKMKINESFICNKVS